MSVITVPHAYCTLLIKHRHCDRVALTAAIEITKQLTKKHVPFELFISNRLRSEVDMNRRVSRSTEFREQITSYLTKHKPLFHLDVHSYPSIAMERRDGPPYYERQNEIYLLDGQDDGETTYTKSFREYLSNHMNKTYKTYAGGANDIQIQFRKALVPSILIEVNEEISAKQLTQLAQGIALWIQTFVTT